MLLTLKVIENLTDEQPKGSGKFKTIKSGIISRLELDTSEFTFREIYDKNGKIYKNKTLIMTKDAGNFVVKHSFDDLVRMKGVQNIKGFRK